MIVKSVIKKLVSGDSTICRGVNFWVAKIEGVNPEGGYLKTYLPRQDNRTPNTWDGGDISVEILEPGVYEVCGQMREGSLPSDPVFNGFFVVDDPAGEPWEISIDQVGNEIK